MKTGSSNLVTAVGGKYRLSVSKSTKNNFHENCNNTQIFLKYKNRINENILSERINKILVKRLQENHEKPIENLDETKSRETLKEVEADGVQSPSEVYNPQSFTDGKLQWKEMKIKGEKHTTKIKHKNDRKGKARTKSFVELLPPF